MLDPRERQRRMRTVMLAGMTGFVLVSVMLLITTPTPRNPIETHQRWMYIAQVAVPSGLLTMSMTYFMTRRRR